MCIELLCFILVYGISFFFGGGGVEWGGGGGNRTGKNVFSKREKYATGLLNINIYIYIKYTLYIYFIKYHIAGALDNEETPPVAARGVDGGTCGRAGGGVCCNGRKFKFRERLRR